MNDHINIGEIIRKNRLKNRMTQQQLANKVNVHVSVISRWEQNKRSLEAPALIKLAAILDDLALELFPSLTKEHNDNDPFVLIINKLEEISREVRRINQRLHVVESSKT